MTKDAFQDLRSPELIKAHDVLGLELFNQGRDAQKKLLEQQPNLLDYFGSDYADRGETYKYTILVVLTGIDAAFLDLEFKEDGRGAGHFIAALGGPFVGIHITGGSIWLTEDLRSLNRTHARVQVIATPPQAPKSPCGKRILASIWEPGPQAASGSVPESSGEKANFTPDHPSDPAGNKKGRRKRRPFF